MTRWHSPSCLSPLVWVGEDSVPRCEACGVSAHEQLQQLTEHPSNPVPPLPPDEKAGQLNLYWPPSVPYIRKQTAALVEEINDCLQISDPPSRTQKSLIHGRTLARDEFRLICLTAREENSPTDVIHLSLETYTDDVFPDYEAVSYTWGSEDGDDTLRHPIYIGEHWDILLQTRNCCEMLRYLYPRRGIRMVWVDAICINQEDMRERGDQVAKMGQIYKRCFQVFLWLGDDIAFKEPGVYPPRLPLYELENLEELQLPAKTERVNIRTLLERRYFSRVWVIQELILPLRIAIPIGDKLFWVDSSTLTHFERLASRAWLWGQTRAPWFQHVTRSSHMQENLAGLLTLTWKSQSSDIRDKVYGVLGLASENEGTQMRPDYGISLKHLLIGLFGHCIIRGGTPQLLLKAAGASAEASMPSWMPLWKGEAWRELFSSNGEENTTWEEVENWLDGVKSDLDREMEPEIAFNLEKYYLARFVPRSFLKEEGKTGKTVFDMRPWHDDATVDADTGAISLNLTRLMSIKNRAVRADAPEEGWYKIEHNNIYDTSDYIYVISQSQLEKVVEAGDDIFLLETNARTLIYLILRKTDKPREFRLIAVCHQLIFLYMSFIRKSDLAELLPVDDLQESLHIDLTRLRGFYGHNVSVLGKDSVDWKVGRHWDLRKRSLFPGRRGPVTFEEVLPLLLGIERDKHERKFKSWRSFQELYLASIDPKFQPRVLNGFCELSFNAKDKWEADRLHDCRRRNIQGVKGWTKVPAEEDAGRVVLGRNMSVIGPELRRLLSGSRISREMDPLMQFDSLVDRLSLEDGDVGERIMAGPVVEDLFRGGTHLGLSPVFKKFELDGSTFKVSIV